MDLRIRSNCCICNSSELQELLTLKDFPIYMGTTLEPFSTDVYADQEWVFCEVCGCTQLKKLIPLEILYSKQHSAGAVGQIWIEHHRAFAEFILKKAKKDICEIGAAHGELSKNILDRHPTIDYLVIEPDPGDVHPSARVLRGYVEDYFQEISKYSTIVHSHVLEHIYEPADFLKKVATNMAFGSRMYLSFPNITKLLETRGTNSLNFEHTYFLHPDQLVSMIKLNGLKVIEEQYYIGHSFFLCLEKTDEKNCEESEIKSIIGTENLLLEMWDELREFVAKANSIMANAHEPVYIFGAHVFSQALISLGLNTKNVMGILDNSTAKNGQRLYGTNLIVFHPEEISKLNYVQVVLKTSHYQEEIREQLLLINPNVEIIE